MDCRLPKGFVAIIAEKPKAGEKIARALSGYPKRCYDSGISYWVFERGGRTYAVLPSSGHLFEISTKVRGFPVFDYYWRPRGEGHRQKAFSLLKKTLPYASEFISACDYDVEGSLICFQIIMKFGDPKRAKRAKFSALTPQDIRRAFERLHPLDWEMAEAGMARHELDWIWGINVSRALMEAYRRGTGKRVSLSAGRVQSPTLVEAARRWREKNLYVPEPQFLLHVQLRKDNPFVAFASFPSAFEGRRAREDVLGAGYLVVASFEEKEVSRRPPPAFNLGDLQKEASRIYKMSPSRTQRIAEELYLEALISYPRTNSQKLPSTIDFGHILAGIGKISRYSELVRRLLGETGGNLRPVQGKEDDPAHPAIHPTGEVPSKDMSEDHWKIYDLIVRRFLAAFSVDAILRTSEALLKDKEGRNYSARGTSVVSEGWMHYYRFSHPSERPIPQLSVGERVSVEGAELSLRWSSFPESISKISLLKWMEEVGIGTEATRADRVEVLYERGYLKMGEEGSVVTDLGYLVASVLKEAFPQLTSVELTRSLEEKVKAIREGKLRKADVLKEAERSVREAVEAYRERLEKVAERIALAEGARRVERKCKVCGREARTSGLCEIHEEALNRLREKVPYISEKLGVSRREAIAEISKVAGKWVREVAEAIERAEISL
ncbi:MAG: DNA topoisomerase I [Acidilobaceae archaeon]|nr:DNA topoisomerase I [Acidilobaceae archaeon]MCX8165960.1 DNA topoisomerase I [Acidilobaceae archaeon]MDW7974603.1 DNA topoisomerase I [Sulfolobales archaeon]